MQKAAYAYLSTQVTTTDQGDLLLLLYEGAIKFLKQAKVKIEERDYAQKGILISRALDVIAELDSSLNAEKGGELAQNLHNLYFYCNTRLLQANLRLNTAQIDEVIRILESLMEAFSQIAKSKFQTKAATVHAPSAEVPAAPAPGGDKPALFSIGKGGGPAPAAHVLAATAQSAAPAYKPAAQAGPVAALRKPVPAPPAALASPQAPARPAAAAAPEAPATASAGKKPAPAPQPEAAKEPSANPELARVKALHRAYGRYGAGH